MNNTITAINFTGKSKTSAKKAEAQNQAVKSVVREEEVKKIVHKTTTPKMRKAILGAASFMAVMFAARRLLVSPTRFVVFKASPKVSGAVDNFVNQVEPYVTGFMNNLSETSKKHLKSDKFTELINKVAKDGDKAQKISEQIYKKAGSLGAKLKGAVQSGLKKPQNIIDYTLAGSFALLSSLGIIKINNLSSKKKIEEIFGDDKKNGKE